MMTAELEGDLTKTVSLGYDQIRRLALAAESLAEDQADVDPEFAAALQSDADHLQRAAASGTVRADDAVDASVSVDFPVAFDD